MATLSDEMIRVVEEQRLGFVATVCPDGTPNLSPKGTVSVWDPDHLVFADICSPRTVANLRMQPAVEINVVDPIRRKGYRFKGAGQVVDRGPDYEAGVQFFRKRSVPNQIRSVVFVRVETGEALVSPVYDRGATEAEVVARWMRRTIDRFEAVIHTDYSRAAGFAALFLRVALAVTLLAAVTDRFGFWGPPGAANVAWGDFSHFEAYAAKLNWLVPRAEIPLLAWVVTCLETGLSLALLLGVRTRRVALASGILLLLFALAMTLATGIKSPLNASVYSASAGAFLLASVRRHVLALDNALGGRVAV
jgi:uncharacterized membrane protein YphA (DoxX/SURF4 family)